MQLLCNVKGHRLKCNIINVTVYLNILCYLDKQHFWTSMCCLMLGFETQPIYCFTICLAPFRLLGSPSTLSQVSCLYTSTELNSKHWERKNLIVYPPQQKDEPRRPAVSNSFNLLLHVMKFIMGLNLFIFLFILFMYNRRFITADDRLNTAKTRCGTWLNW